MKKVIVTGGSGFIGGHIVRRLLEQGIEVVNIDIKLDPKLDVRDVDLLREKFVGADTVFHLAALPSVPYSIEHPLDTNETNLTGTLNVLVAARDARVKRVIFSSSAAVYGQQDVLPVQEDAPKRPMSPYAMQKLSSEEYLELFSRIYEVETVSLRYFNVFGEGQNPDGPYASAIPKFLKMRSEGEPLTIFGNGEQTRDFVHVSDVVAANIAAATSQKVGRGESINIASGSEATINEIARLIGGEVNYLPPRLEIKNSVASIDKARHLLDWEPRVVLEEGIKELL